VSASENYPEPPKYWHKWLISKFFLVRLLQLLTIHGKAACQPNKEELRDQPFVPVLGRLRIVSDADTYEPKLWGCILNAFTPSATAYNVGLLAQ